MYVWTRLYVCARVRACLRVRALRLNDNADPEFGEEVLVFIMQVKFEQTWGVR